MTSEVESRGDQMMNWTHCGHEEVLTRLILKKIPQKHFSLSFFYAISRIKTIEISKIGVNTVSVIYGR